ncbi:hypothetical protein, partial [Lysinibacillus xylanilyticus]|uniref:hypothetical protein n=1 Tax=Lysinibacillus xylanilyticus TaxID=582475 RepID=UPI003D016BA5
KAKRQQQMFYLRESEASATNVLSARKRSVSNKCFICAKAKRQQQCFNCAKAKRQQQCFNCAKAKRQQQSDQSERKSTTRFGDEPTFCKSSHPQKKTLKSTSTLAFFTKLAIFTVL